MVISSSVSLPSAWSVVFLSTNTMFGFTNLDQYCFIYHEGKEQHGCGMSMLELLF